MLIFVEDGLETKLIKNARTLYEHLPTPWNWYQLSKLRQPKVGLFAIDSLWRSPKKRLVKKIYKKLALRLAPLFAPLIFIKRWRKS
jgi:hypothetical protein